MTRRPAPALYALSPGKRRRIAARVLSRAAASAVGLVALYYVLPLNKLGNGASVVLLVVAMAGVVVILGWQVRAILAADYPGMQAVEGLAMVLPLFLLGFSTAYYLIELHVPGSFTQPLTRTGAIYFAVTTFSTVGYGDIAPVTDAARVVVIFQMITDLIAIGFGARLLVGAVQMRRKDNASGDRSS